MLPGFRILFATIVLAASVLVFGLGAAALLRASHEEFAALPSWRLAQQPQFAPKAEVAPTLALLRVEAPTPKTFVQEILPSPFAQSRATQPVTALAFESVRSFKDIEPPAVTLTAQANTDEPPAPEELVAATAEPVDTTASEPSVTAAPPVGTILPALDIRTFSETEASEPQTTQSVTPQVRSTEATATETLPKPVMKRTKRSARAIALRRAAVNRARAAKAAQQQQRTSQFPLFGG